MQDPKSSPVVAVQARQVLPSETPSAAPTLPGWGDTPSASAAMAAQAQPAAPSATAAAEGTAPVTLVSYRVQSGDTLAAIALAFYGSPERWRTILDANPGLDPAELKVGQILKVPLLPAGAR
jgi:nucleoid-associated protein YgaU